MNAVPINDNPLVNSLDQQKKGKDNINFTTQIVFSKRK